MSSDVFPLLAYYNDICEGAKNARVSKPTVDGQTSH